MSSFVNKCKETKTKRKRKEVEGVKRQEVKANVFATASLPSPNFYIYL